MTDTAQAARIALACLDLTSLNDADTEADIEQICARAQGPHGRVAAVCVWPRFAALARRSLPPAIAVAAVANFPDGSGDVERATRDAASIVDSGAQEIDLVLPFGHLQRGDVEAAERVLVAVRRATKGLVLKVILETGILVDTALIRQASRIALDAGADFLKTSTGKTPVSASPAAARVMLDAIAGDAHASTHAGFKASGGVRTVADAALYIDLCSAALGPAALRPQRFRIGASGLLNDIEAVLSDQTPKASTGGY